jgi:hypothetical protein
MTDDELRQYVDAQVELRMTSGLTLLGMMVAGTEARVFGAPFAIRSVYESATLSTLEQAYTAIPSAEAVASARILKAALDDALLTD